MISTKISCFHLTPSPKEGIWDNFDMSIIVCVFDRGWLNEIG